MNHHQLQPLLIVLLLAVVPAPAASGGDWPTYRGTSARTGNIDGVAGPAANPKILWSHGTKDHFVGSVATDGKAIYLPVETFGRVYMQADDWHTDATGYELIAAAVATAIQNSQVSGLKSHDH